MIRGADFGALDRQNNQTFGMLERMDAKKDRRADSAADGLLKAAASGVSWDAAYQAYGQDLRQHQVSLLQESFKKISKQAKDAEKQQTGQRVGEAAQASATAQAPSGTLDQLRHSTNLRAQLGDDPGVLTQLGAETDTIQQGAAAGAEQHRVKNLSPEGKQVEEIFGLGAEGERELRRSWDAKRKTPWETSLSEAVEDELIPAEEADRMRVESIRSLLANVKSKKGDSIWVMGPPRPIKARV